MWAVVWLIAAKLHSHHPGHFRPHPLEARHDLLQHDVGEPQEVQLRGLGLAHALAAAIGLALGLATATAIGIGISLAAALAAGIAAGLGLGVATAVALDLALAAGMALTTAVALAPTAESGLEGCGSSNPPIGVARWAPGGRLFLPGVRPFLRAIAALRNLAVSARCSSCSGEAIPIHE